MFWPDENQGQKKMLLGEGGVCVFPCWVGAGVFVSGNKISTEHCMGPLSVSFLIQCKNQCLFLSQDNEMQNLGFGQVFGFQ